MLQATTHDGPLQRQCAAASHESAQRAAEPQSTTQLLSPAQVTPQSAAEPHWTWQLAASLHVTPHDTASSHATSHGPPVQFAPHDATSMHSTLQVEALQAHAESVHTHAPPEHSALGSSPHATSR